MKTYHHLLVRSLTRYFCSTPSTPHVALKNVTRSNFEPVLAELRRHVVESDFVAIDLEMTGVTSAPWRESFEFDRPDVQYLKVKDSAEKFAVVQFGVCSFRWDSTTQSFVTHPHNFYIFPRQEIVGDSSSREFLCQTSSLEFLARYQFDFNVCIYEGISYLSRSQEEEAIRRFDMVYKNKFANLSSSSRKNEDGQLIRMSDILFSERMKNGLNQWRAELSCGGNSAASFQWSLNGTNEKFHTTFFHLRPALAVNSLTPRQLRLIELVAEKHFGDLIYVDVPGEDSTQKALIVYADSETDKALLMDQVKTCQRKEAEMKIKSAVGFRHVIDLLSSERKLIVGHNCFLDIAHVYSKFIADLPSTAEEFVSFLQKHFPHIIDTKVLLNSDEALSRMMGKNGTSLSKSFGFLCPQIALSGMSRGLIDKSQVKIEVQVDDQRFSNWNSGAKHEAGYDAFMTGCVFSQACSHLGIDFNSPTSPPHLNLPNNEKLQRHINHLYLSWLSGDIIDLNTGKIAPEYSSSSATSRRRKSPKIAFSNTVLLWGLLSSLKANDIKSCFLKAFGIGSVISVFHIDDSAAFVEFSKEELVSEFLRLKDSLEEKGNPISVLHPLSQILEPHGCLRAARYEMYKEICGSSLSEVVFADQAEAVGVEWKSERVNVKPDDDDDDDKNIVVDHVMNTSSNSYDESIDSLYSAEAQLSK